MNANTENTQTNATVAPVAHTTTEGNNMNTDTNTSEVAPRHYKKTVLEMYTEWVDRVIDSKKTAVQVSKSGNQYSGLNAKILNEVKAELNYKSNCWLTAKQMEMEGLINHEEDFGVILFSTKLVDIEGSNRKNKVLNYYRVFNMDSLKSVF